MRVVKQVLSGAKTLSAAGLTWEKYNVVDGGSQWKTEPGMNAVYAMDPSGKPVDGPVSIHGKTATAALCEVRFSV